jgi:hypothetical protein
LPPFIGVLLLHLEPYQISFLKKKKYRRKRYDQSQNFCKPVKNISCQKGTYKVQRIISVSDAPTSDDNGATIGLIRVIAYE